MSEGVENAPDFRRKHAGSTHFISHNNLFGILLELLIVCQKLQADKKKIKERAMQEITSLRVLSLYPSSLLLIVLAERSCLIARSSRYTSHQF
jgi:hypothetical protein